MKVNVKNRDKIKEIIEKVEGDSYKRTLEILYVDDAIYEAESFLKKLNIPEVFWLKTRIEVHPEQVSSSYKWPAEGTYVFLERFALGWFLVECTRNQVKPNGKGQENYIVLGSLALENIPRAINL